MKTRKILSLALACVLLLALLAACQSSPSPSGTTASPSPSPSGSPTIPASPSPDVAAALREAAGLDDNNRFTTTRKITVEIYDRANAGGSIPEDNFYTNYIKSGVLADHNIEVTYKPVPRFPEDTTINNLLAANDAPDVCITYSYPTILEYANMGGVLDLASLVDDYAFLASDMWDFLGEDLVNWERDPASGVLWAIKTRQTSLNRINTFVREDWLAALKMNEPTTMDEFETMLKAFKDNASTLLGDDASKMVPLSISWDVGWRTELINTAFVDHNMTDKDTYVYGFDDRRLLFPGYKEGVRKLNQWYNEGLIWQEFAIHPSGDSTEDDMCRAGYVGSFLHNWDYPFRNGATGLQFNMQELRGEEAAWIAVDTFKDNADTYRKFVAAPTDRNIFFPATNKEPIASLLYVNWVTIYEHRNYLQVGDEGVTHQVMADGSYKTLATTGDKIMNSPNNIDYTLTCNGLFIDGNPELTAKSIANNYANVDARYVEKAYNVAANAQRVGFNAKAGIIAAESGMATPLKEKRDAFLAQAVVAPVSQFDSIFDAGMADYLASGGQAIIDERKAAWERIYGTETGRPE